MAHSVGKWAWRPWLGRAAACRPRNLRMVKRSNSPSLLRKPAQPRTCSYRLSSGRRTAPSTRACFMEAGFRIFHLQPGARVVTKELHVTARVARRHPRAAAHRGSGARIFHLHSTARMGRAQWPALTCGETGCCIGHAAAVAQQPRPHRTASLRGLYWIAGKLRPPPPVTPRWCR